MDKYFCGDPHKSPSAPVTLSIKGPSIKLHCNIEFEEIYLIIFDLILSFLFELKSAVLYVFSKLYQPVWHFMLLPIFYLSSAF